MDAPSRSALLDVAAGLSRQAGLAAPLDLEPLAGGKNNRVFRVPLADGTALVLKSYFTDARDPRDRLGAEWAFASYAWARGIRSVPEPMARHDALRLGLYRHMPGRKLTVSELGADAITAAADFIVALNATPRDLSFLAPGSEACFSLREHEAAVDGRVKRLAANGASVMPFITRRLSPAWDAVKARLAADLAHAGIDAEAPIDPAAVIASPSDFGFHNALFDASTGALGFIDFEYAGRDDPAKLVCDFFCQPEIPVPRAMHDAFLDRLVTGLDLADEHRERCRLLLDLYRIKWAAIILNPVLAIGAARRAFADRDADVALLIARADAQIEALSIR